MALHIIDESSLGGRLGAAVGTGLSGLMENLVQSKARQVQQNQRALGYEKGFGLNPEAAKTLASQPEEFQQQAFKALIEAQQNEALQRKLHPESFQSAPMQALGAGAQPQAPSLESAMSALGGNQDPQDAIMQNLAKILPQLQQQAAQGQPAILPQELPSPASSQISPEMAPKGRSIEDVFRNKPLNPQLSIKAEELQERKRGNAFKEQILAYKQVGKQLDELHNKAERGRKDKAELERAKKYNASGQLRQGKARQLLEAVGLQDFFTNEPTQVVDKILARLESGASEAYGTGRLTNFLADNYKRQLPRLINTKEGFEAIANNIIDEIDATEAVDKEARKIEREYNRAGVPIPFDVLSQARENARPQLDALEQRSSQRVDEAIAKIDKRGSAKGFSSLPTASDYSGRTITDTKTGNKYKSNGSKWVKA